MSSGETYETKFSEDLADRARLPKCACGNRPTVGDIVTVWSSNWKIGDLRIVACPKCKEQRREQ